MSALSKKTRDLASNINKDISTIGRARIVRLLRLAVVMVTATILPHTMNALKLVKSRRILRNNADFRHPRDHAEPSSIIISTTGLVRNASSSNMADAAETPIVSRQKRTA